MKPRVWLVPVLPCLLWLLPGLPPAGADGLPMPRVWHEEEPRRFSKADFEQALEKMKSERLALEGDWQALLKRSGQSPARKDSEDQLQNQLKELVKLLQESRAHGQPRELEISDKKIDPLVPVPPGPNDDKSPAKENVSPDPVPGSLDALSEAQALFRAGRFEEALSSFRQIELKGKKADARAPVQYLMAMCHLHLNQTEEALPLLREVANSRGDEKLADYAQWQLDMCRWHREINDRLQDFRKRRQAQEKKL
jgi:tetratricopeptide (TPR) repeat protein